MGTQAMLEKRAVPLWCGLGLTVYFPPPPQLLLYERSLEYLSRCVCQAASYLAHPFRLLIGPSASLISSLLCWPGLYC